MGILLVYDVTNRLTFDSIRTWMEAIEQVRCPPCRATSRTTRLSRMEVCVCACVAASPCCRRCLSLSRGLFAQHASESVNKVLLGNKADSSGPMVSKRAVPTEVGQKLATEFNLKFFETSAKNNINIDEAFFTIARDIQLRLLAAEQAPAALTGGGLRLGAGSGGKPAQEKGCC